MGRAGRFEHNSSRLILIGTVALIILLLWGVELEQARGYDAMVANNTVNIDAYVTRGIEGFPLPKPSIFDRAKVVFLHTISTLGHKRRNSGISLAITQSPYVKGLLVSSQKDMSSLEDEKPHTHKHKIMCAHGACAQSDVDINQEMIIVGTIRMGFGHHRIAYATSSWGLEAGLTTLFHDLLSIKSPEANLIKKADALYSLGSRLASEIGGFVETFFGSLTAKGGDANALRTSYQLAEVIQPLFLGLPTDRPVIATHSLVGLVARAAGFKHVINLVIDNHPQWFLIVPGAINLVQGPKSYHAFIRMGVPEEELRIAGHWVPAEIVNNIQQDTKARLNRIARSAPVRILMPVGGAGAQRRFVASFLKSFEGMIKAGTVQILLNAGDHKHMKDTFVDVLEKMGLEHKYDVIDTIEGVHKFADARRHGSEPNNAVTLFAFDDYFPAVAATDILIRVSDVLACKPSEMAFYPVPKLMLRRVGDHEADSAVRANELGDGTIEIREPQEALAWVTLFKTRPSLLTDMNNEILKNAKNGVYDGCKVAVDMAKAVSSHHFNTHKHTSGTVTPSDGDELLDNCTATHFGGYRVCKNAYKYAEKLHISESKNQDVDPSILSDPNCTNWDIGFKHYKYCKAN